MIPALVSLLISNGLPLLADFLIKKGSEEFTKRTGIPVDASQIDTPSLEKLRQFETDNEDELMKYKLEDRKVDLEFEKVSAGDRSNARSMQVSALSSDSKLAKNFIYYFAILWTIAAIVYIGCITFIQIPDDNIRFADTILGFMLGTVISTIVGFFFGSSAASRSKDEVISHAVSKGSPETNRASPPQAQGPQATNIIVPGDSASVEVSNYERAGG